MMRRLTVVIQLDEKLPWDELKAEARRLYRGFQVSTMLRFETSELHVTGSTVDVFAVLTRHHGGDAVAGIRALYAALEREVEAAMTVEAPTAT